MTRDEAAQYVTNAILQDYGMKKALEQGPPLKRALLALTAPAAPSADWKDPMPLPAPQLTAAPSAEATCACPPIKRDGTMLRNGREGYGHYGHDGAYFGPCKPAPAPGAEATKKADPIGWLGSDGYRVIDTRPRGACHSEPGYDGAAPMITAPTPAASFEEAVIALERAQDMVTGYASDYGKGGGYSADKMLELHGKRRAARQRVVQMYQEQVRLRDIAKEARDQWERNCEYARDECRKAEAEAARVKAAIAWALGEGDSDFAEREPKGVAAKFWWRVELRKRAGLADVKP